MFAKETASPKAKVAASEPRKKAALHEHTVQGSTHNISLYICAGDLVGLFCRSSKQPIHTDSFCLSGSRVKGTNTKNVCYMEGSYKPPVGSVPSTALPRISNE